MGEQTRSKLLRAYRVAKKSTGNYPPQSRHGWQRQQRHNPNERTRAAAAPVAEERSSYTTKGGTNTPKAQTELCMLKER